MAKAEHENTAVGRRLFGAVTLWQDWGDEPTESDPKYWELFTDLLMVAAASSMADGFQSNQTWFGLLEFFLLYSVITHGWLLYTHHFTSRFLESSLLHSGILFFYLLGMAITIVNASLETAQDFSQGVVLQRLSFLAIIGQVFWTLPRARDFASLIMIVVSVSIILFSITALYDYENTRFIVLIWTAAAIIDWFAEIVFINFLDRSQLVPINIEHSQDRLGVLVLVMMGETVISATIAYRDYVEDGIGKEEKHELYLVLLFSFLLVFMFTLLYFHVQPHPRDHAFRRSRATGIACLVMNKLLGMTLLLVGVCVKLAVKAAAEGEILDVFSRRLLNVSVGSSMLLLFGIRCCHYAGRLPGESHPPHAKLIMWIWWAVFAVGSVCPFAFPHWDGHPIPPLAVSSVWLLVLCIVETSFTHVLDKDVAIKPHHKEGIDEHTPLQGEGSLYTAGHQSS